VANDYPDNNTASIAGNQDDSKHPSEFIGQDTAKWRGIIIHRVLELLGEAMDYPAANKTVNRIQHQVKSEIFLTHPAALQHIDSCVQEAVSTFNNDNLAGIFNPAPGSKCFNEMPLMYIQDQQPVHGIVDRVIRHDDRVLIIDYKTRHIDETETLQGAARQYSSQLAYYRNGIKRLWPGHTVQTGILFTHYREIVWL
jgi:ATP-dependent exoDNAse (exonuclease V) beta subunit